MKPHRIAVAVVSLAAATIPVLSLVNAAATPSVPSGPAPRAPQAVAVPAGWNGKCYTNWHTSRAVNMWCDGKGPERYGVSAVCTKGRHTYQYNSRSHPWFGDRRGATVTCRKGTLTTWWGYPAN